MFKHNHPRRFHAKHCQKAACTKLYSQGSVVTNMEDLLECWVGHFSSLGQSECSSNDFLQASQEMIKDLASESLSNYDNIFDSEIDVEG
jgi:hypothetical protein